MKNLEQELKLQLDEREYGILAALTTAQPQLQINYYFTSRNLARDIMVRVRQKGDTFLLCYKERLQTSSNVTVCDERECEITQSFAESMVRRGILPSEINSMLKTDLDEMLTCAGRMDTYRTAFDYGEWRLELDKSEYLGITDYELECESTYVQQLYKLRNYLVYKFGLVIKESAPKSQRFFQAKEAQQ